MNKREYAIRANRNELDKVQLDRIERKVDILLCLLTQGKDCVEIAVAGKANSIANHLDTKGVAKNGTRKQSKTKDGLSSGCDAVPQLEKENKVGE